MKQKKIYEEPIFDDYASSYNKDLYFLETGIASAPVVIWRADRNLGQIMSMPVIPQVVMLQVNDDLYVKDEEGYAFCDLRDAVKLITPRSIPVFVVNEEITADYLISFLRENFIADAFVCASFKKRELIKYVCEAHPLLRGVLDFSDMTLGKDRIRKLSMILAACHASVALLSSQTARKSVIRYVQKRLCGVWIESESIVDEITRGSNGIVTPPVPKTV